MVLLRDRDQQKPNQMELARRELERYQAERSPPIANLGIKSKPKKDSKAANKSEKMSKGNGSIGIKKKEKKKETNNAVKTVKASKQPKPVKQVVEQTPVKKAPARERGSSQKRSASIKRDSAPKSNRTNSTTRKSKMEDEAPIYKRPSSVVNRTNVGNTSLPLLKQIAKDVADLKKAKAEHPPSKPASRKIIHVNPEAEAKLSILANAIKSTLSSEKRQVLIDWITSHHGSNTANEISLLLLAERPARKTASVARTHAVGVPSHHSPTANPGGQVQASSSGKAPAVPGRHGAGQTKHLQRPAISTGHPSGQGSTGHGTHAGQGAGPVGPTSSGNNHGPPSTQQQQHTPRSKKQQRTADGSETVSLGKHPLPVADPDTQPASLVANPRREEVCPPLVAAAAAGLPDRPPN